MKINHNLRGGMLHAMLFAIVAALNISPAYTQESAGTGVTTWAELNTAQTPGDVYLKNDLTITDADARVKIEETNKVIDGKNHGVTGDKQNTSGYFHITSGKTSAPLAGSSLTIRNFGSSSFVSVTDPVAEAATYDYSYTDLSGKVVYVKNDAAIRNLKTTPVSIYGFESVLIDRVIISDNKEITSYYDGGAMNFLACGSVDISHSQFINNSTTDGEDGGSIRLTGNAPNTINSITDSAFVGNYSGNDGGAISTQYNVKHIENVVFEGNEAARQGGALWFGSWGAGNAPLVIVNSVFRNNTASSAGGAVFADCDVAHISFVDTDFIGNTRTSGYSAGAVYATTQVNVYADRKDVLFADNKVYNADHPNGTLNDLRVDVYNYNPEDYACNFAAAENRSITFNGVVDAYVDYDYWNGEYATLNLNAPNQSYSMSDGATRTIEGAGEIIFNNEVNNMDIMLHAGKLSVGQNKENNASASNPDGYLNNSGLTIVGDSALNTVNGVIGTFRPQAFTVNQGVTLSYSFDVDLKNGTSDALVVTRVAEQGTIHLTGINVISHSDQAKTVVNFTTDETLKGKVVSDVAEVMGPVVKYTVAYDAATGDLTFTLPSAEDDTTPDPVPGPVPGSSPSDFNPHVFAPAVAAVSGSYMTQSISYEQAFAGLGLDEALRTKRNFWARAYSSFEDIDMGSIDTDANLYGAYAGADSRHYRYRRGVSASYGVYLGCHHADIEYDGVDVSQSGATVGLRAIAQTKRHAFAGITANVGLSDGESKFRGARDKFDTRTAGVAVKMGKNFGFKDRKYIFQPNLGLAWSMIDVRDYMHGADVSMKHRTQNIVTLTPGVKAMAHLGRGYTPYAELAYVHHMGDETEVTAGSMKLPELELDPHARATMGLMKSWEKTSVHIEADMKVGSREGYGVNAGIQWQW